MKYTILLCLILTVFSCHENLSNDSHTRLLSPTESIKDFCIEKGFEIQTVASEPLIEDPVAMVFDPDANIWLVEMRGYMNDMEGSSETKPSGRIKILKDLDKDGTYESSSIFLDSLVLPRAIALAYDGALIIEPPCLYFIENKNGKPGKKTIIDPAFADAGNVEHQPNGLIRNIDNWYYCAKSNKRVQRQDGKWIVESTQFRGQWGISNDDFGRLYYNDNSNMLYGDNLLPNSIGNNPAQTMLTKKLYSSSLANNKVFPSRSTPGINRGYEEGMLDDTGRLVNVTSACGPLIYRGDNFPERFYGNAFIMEPTAFLIKRLILKDNPKGFMEGIFAEKDNEFLTATDERFRPVNACNAPDGTMYVIDMHRGLIQHTTYLTQYLRQYIDSLQLAQPVHQGRIYRIKWKEKPLRPSMALSGLSSIQLMDLLKNSNSWQRETAQRLLSEREDTTICEPLRSLCRNSENISEKLSALWILASWHQLDLHFLETIALEAKNPSITSHAMYLMATLPSKNEAIKSLLSIRTPNLYTTELQFAAATANLAAQKAISWTDVLQYNASNLADSLFIDIVVSYATGLENQIKTAAVAAKSGSLLVNALQLSLDKSRTPIDEQLAYLSKADKERYNDGKGHFKKYCSTCHGEDGAGMSGLGPPLINSEWVLQKDISIPIRILLDGMKGEILVNGKMYNPAAAMPGLRNNKELNNGTIAAILTFIRNSWGNKASCTDALEVGRVRAATVSQKNPYSPHELVPENNIGYIFSGKNSEFKAEFASFGPRWKKLFNGKNLAGWHQVGGQALYEVQHNMIAGISVENTPNSFLVTDKVYKDFILELDFKIDTSLNSGIQIRSNSIPEYNNGQFHGYQVEIDPSSRAWSGGIYDEGRRGWLFDLKHLPEAQKAFHKTGWNHYRIEAIGSHIRTWVNGVPAADLEDDMTGSGHIGLQVHGIGNDIWKKGKKILWKNLKIIEM